MEITIECAWCHRIREKNGGEVRWLRKTPDPKAETSHGICDVCFALELRKVKEYYHEN